MSEKELVQWIIEHSDDQELMDRINQITFPFTSKFRSFNRGF